ncbi:MAG: deoxyribose-phosphate aldolase [Bacteroidetes bacterium]|jgi:deoxyribose-phosphate aldolase|nr:deoxyribose-phosphate aldolase [Bacteroidota bacterium]
MDLFDRALAGMIDHTLLKPEATPADVKTVCEEALRFRFASVCVNPCYVPQCVAALRDSGVAVCTVVGFPLGAATTPVKTFETEQALKAGAREIDMVINIGLLKSGDDRAVEADIRAVCDAAHRGEALCKVIIETALLTDDEKIRACLLAKNAGADFVKTSTGFSKAGATAADVGLMRRTVGEEIGVKAAGGIRTRQDALAMVTAGATRIGASASVALVHDTVGNILRTTP